MKVLVGNNYGSYTFTASTGVITLSGLPTALAPGQPLLIVDATNNKVLFNLVDPSVTAVVGTNTITLSSVPSGVADTDTLQIFLDVPASVVAVPLPANAAQDGTDATGVSQLAGGVGIRGWLSGIFSALATLVAAGIGRTWTLGSGTDSVTATITGTPAVSVTNLPVTQPVSDSVMRSTVVLPGSNVLTPLVIVGGQTADASPQYQELPLSSNGAAVRVDGSLATQPTAVATPQASDNPLFVSVTGNPNGDFAGVDLLEQVVTDNSGMAINVRTLNSPPKSDVQGALISSDAPLAISISSPTGGPLPVGAYMVIDTTGYEAIQVTTQALAANAFSSGDGITWDAVSGIKVGAPTAIVTAVAATGNYEFPCSARYFKLTVTTAGTAVAYLRLQPHTQGAVVAASIGYIGNTAIVTAGVAGIPTVGGNIAPGSGATAYPVPIGGVDYGALTRRMQQDSNGNPQVVGPLPVGYQTNKFGNTLTGASVQSLATWQPAVTQPQAVVYPVLAGATDQSNTVRQLRSDANGAVLVRHVPSDGSNTTVEDLLSQILATLRVLALYTYDASPRSVDQEPDNLIAELLSSPNSTIVQ